MVRDQPSVAAAIVRLFLSLPSFLLPFFLSFLLFFVRVEPSSLPFHPDQTLLISPSISSSFPIPSAKVSLGRWIFTSGEIRDINSGSMATFTATTQIVLTGNQPQEFQEDNG